MTNKLHVPLGFVPLNTDRPAPLPTEGGAGGKKTSSTSLLVGWNVPLCGKVIRELAASSSVTVMFVAPTHAGDSSSRASEMSLTSAPVGPTRRMSSCGMHVCETMQG